MRLFRQSWLTSPAKADGYFASYGAAEAAPLKAILFNYLSPTNGSGRLVFFLELFKLTFKLPLHPCALVRCEKVFACGRKFFDARLICGAGRGDAEYYFRLLPQAPAGQETVLDALPRHAFQVGVGQVISLHRA